jgi:DNA-binding LacI/PurR family transcriptional regulator
VDGVVVIASHDEAVRAVKDYSRKLPVVMVGPGQVSGHIHTVAVDQYAGASLAVGHLLDLGHRDVLHVRGPSVWLDARARERGWLDAMLQAGVRPEDPVQGDWTASAGFAIGRSLLGRRDVVPLPTAVFTANDQLALGLLHAFADAGVNVPREVSVVGFDDVEGSEHFFPPLTTVRPDWSALGRRSLERMTAAIERQPAEGVLVGARLVVRSSSAAPRP